MSIATENYLKQIYLISGENTSSNRSQCNNLVSLGKLAETMKVTPGTITTMMKNLTEVNLVEYQPRSGVRLTQEGKKKALAVIRRHRLIELFLVRILGLDWRYVHDEAEVLEHALSDRLIGRIDEILGFPEVDPHGDPIPSASGVMLEQNSVPLSNIIKPSKLIILRVEHAEKSFLDFLSLHHLLPGTNIYLEGHDKESGTISLVSHGSRCTMSFEVASRIQVIEADNL